MPAQAVTGAVQVQQQQNQRALLIHLRLRLPLDLLLLGQLMAARRLSAMQWLKHKRQGGAQSKKDIESC